MLLKKNKTFYHMWNDSSKGSKGNDGGVKPGNKSQSFHADMSYKNSHMAYSTITISEFLTLVSKLKLSANIDQQIMLKLICDLMYMIFNRWMIQNCYHQYRIATLTLNGWLCLKLLFDSPGQSDDDNLLTFICFHLECLTGSRCKGAAISTGVSPPERAL